MNFDVLNNPKLFFTEWKDKTEVFIPFGAMTMMLMVGLLWVMPNIPDYKIQADIFWNFLVIGLIIGAFDLLIGEKNPLTGFLFVGKSFRVVLYAFIIG